MTEPLTVLKFSGAVTREPGTLRRAIRGVQSLAREHRLLIVPGGGEFADAVRVAWRQGELGDSAAHWMAILAMDQMAHLLADRLDGAVLVADPAEGARVAVPGHIAILAPFAWLRGVDTLPHSWDVTSDSVAALVAAQVEAAELLLLKMVEGPLEELVDANFERVVPPAMPVRIVTPEGLAAADLEPGDAGAVP